MKINLKFYKEQNIKKTVVTCKSTSMSFALFCNILHGNYSRSSSLGRAYALAFAERGAKVIVNDLGTATGGEGIDTSAADGVAKEIEANGGIAVPNYDSVENGDRIIETAIKNFNKVDILINNAGIIRDRGFHRMTVVDWDDVQNIHLRGAFIMSKAAWPHMRRNRFGRIIFTTSDVGLFGNFGQANYAAAKAGLIGLCKSLALEGLKFNILCNCVAPTAFSRMTENFLPSDLHHHLAPNLVAPFVLNLCHEKCKENGSVFEVAGGWASQVKPFRTTGVNIQKLDSLFSLEDVHENWKTIVDPSTFHPTGDLGLNQFMNFVSKVIVNKNSPSVIVPYNISHNNVSLYNMSVGAKASDSQFVYEGHPKFAALPTFACIIPQRGVTKELFHRHPLLQSTELKKVLHGEHYVELFAPIPVEEAVTSNVYIAEVLDKGIGRCAIINAETFDSTGKKLAFNQFSVLVLGGGNFGGKRNSDSVKQCAAHPDRLYDKAVSEMISEDQAAWYRLNGDLNPLHIDTDFARTAGFKKPIAHGLCVLGFATRHVIENYLNGDRVKSIKVRFSNPVYPGEVIQTQMWKENSIVYFQCHVPQRNSCVLTGGYIEFEPSLVKTSKL